MTKNYFDTNNKDYSVVRPEYPVKLFDYILKRTKERGTSLDCGAGNGQATKPLSLHFKDSIGLDLSPNQLSQTQKDNPNTQYIAGSSNTIPFKENSFDLVTVAEAIHWFDLDLFYNEVVRVLKPDGKIAVWCYYLPEISPEVDKITNNLFHETLKEYIDDRRLLIKDGYRDLDFPFEDTERNTFTTTKNWTLQDMFNNLYTSSQVKKHIERTGIDPVQKIAQSLEKAWGNPKNMRQAKWDVNLIIGSGHKINYNNSGIDNSKSKQDLKPAL